MDLEQTPLDEVIRVALAEHEAWIRKTRHEQDDIEPRIPVIVSETKVVWRHPYQRKGVWHVRYAGHRRLCDPIRINGFITFHIQDVNHRCSSGV